MTIARWLLLLHLLCGDASATLVVFQWSPTEILLAADSLTTKVTTTQLSGVIEPKIHQSGDVFFTIVGVNQDPAINVDLIALATRATRSKGSVEEQMTQFRTLAKTQIDRIMQRNLTAQLGFNERQSVTLIFANRRSHSLVCQEFTRNNDGSTATLPSQSYHAPGKAIDPVSVGVSAEAEAFTQRTPALSRLEGVPFIIGFIQAQIDHERYRRRTLHQLQRVGGDICVLRIANGKAAWVEGHQGPCLPIKP